MAEHIIFPQWRETNSHTRYPFSDEATLVNEAGKVILETAFLDAALHPIGGLAGLFLSKVVVTHEDITFYVGDLVERERASGTIALVSSPDEIILTDAYGRPAGVIVSTTERLSVFQAWGVGTHEFEPDESEFAATVCVPSPEIGVRGFVLESGEVLTGDVWLVGDDGVVVRPEVVSVPGDCENPEQVFETIRIDIVGDPLFRRRLCKPTDLFFTPRFIKRITVIDPSGISFDSTPDEFGGILLVTNNSLAVDTVLRIVPQGNGVLIHVVGTPNPTDA